MTIEPAAWLELARRGARKARVPSCDVDDAVGAILEDFVRQPPIEPGEAVNRGEHRAIDFMRSWRGNPRTCSGQRRLATSTASDAEAAYLSAGASDIELALVELDDVVARSGLSDAEHEALLLHVAGYGHHELADGSRKALHRARAKLRGAA